MKQSTWQTPKVKLKVVGGEKKCWTLYKCDSDTMVAILPRKRNINSGIFTKHYCLFPMFFFFFFKDHFLNYNRMWWERERPPDFSWVSCHLLNSLSMPSMKMSLLPRGHVVPFFPSNAAELLVRIHGSGQPSPSHHCYSTGWQRSALVILCPFLPLPNLVSLLQAAGVILLKYNRVHITSLTLNPSSVLTHGKPSRHLPKPPRSCVTRPPAPCSLHSRNAGRLSVSWMYQALACLCTSYLPCQSHWNFFSQLTEHF